MPRKNKRYRANTEQYNAKFDKQEAAELQSVNTEFFGGNLNKSDLMRFITTVALAAIENGKVEVETTKVLKVGDRAIDMASNKVIKVGKRAAR